MRVNYLPWVPNPFNLSAPPDFFLDMLSTYDDRLVLFPSAEEPVYRVARRWFGTTPEGFIAVQHRPDTLTYRTHRLVPVKSLLPSSMTHWGPVVINDLAESDIQRLGGAEAVCKLLEEREARAATKLDATIRDDVDELARFAWKAIKWRSGETVDLGARKPEGARSRTPARRRQFAYRPTASGAGFWRDPTPARNGAAYVDSEVTVLAIPPGRLLSRRSVLVAS